MPNHLHGIIAIDEEDSGKGGSRTASTIFPKRKPLGRLVGTLKTVSTKRINELRQTPGFVLWQHNYCEHIIRNENSLNKIRNYVLNNPLKWDFDLENPTASSNQASRSKGALLEKTFF
ncbi:MAG TPA: transposase [candidate division Zixibacteria bacterium]|nr:transposase [candidate division Zixibacteria bacterium]